MSTELLGVEASLAEPVHLPRLAQEASRAPILRTPTLMVGHEQCSFAARRRRRLLALFASALGP
jgi:hypothetical protein